MICPECKSEYRQGFLTCADCNVELVPLLLPESPGGESANDYAEYSDLLESMDTAFVSFIRSVLESEGIDHYVLGEHASNVFALSVQQIVRVRSDQIQRAREILDDIENNTPPEIS